MLNHTLYNVGDVWKSNDNCSMFECKPAPGNTTDPAVVSEFKKRCPENLGCDESDRYFADCCQHCRSPLSARGFTYPTEETAKLLSRDTYRNHPCNRKCTPNENAKICNYTFRVLSFAFKIILQVTLEC